MYHSIDDELYKDSTGVMTLYDAHFQVVGMWSEINGRAMLGDAFYVREDANTGRERERNNERDCVQVDLSKRVVDSTDQMGQINCRTYQTCGRQSVTSAI